jgi:arsenite-transporting ATPase
MEIKVLGSGCSKCHSTVGIIERAALASAVDVEIVKVENPDETSALASEPPRQS